MEVHPIESAAEETEIIHVEYDIDTLVISVNIGNKIKKINFKNPDGFRVLDEGDLLEFWPKCSTANGWLFEIASGGWLDQESQRGGFLLPDKKDVKEYFITGINYCINVFAWEHPRVE